MAKYSFYRRTLLTIGAVLISTGIGIGTLGNLSHKSYLASLVVAVVLAVALALIRKHCSGVFNCLEHFNPVVVCAVISVGSLLLNGAWVFHFHPVQAPDYQTFYEAAVNLSEGVTLKNRDYIAMFPHILGYVVFLSISLRLFGQSLMTAAVGNVLLTTASGILIYALSLRWTGRRTAAAFACLLWAICPSKLLYNTMALSEPYYTFLLLLFLLLTSLVFDRSHPYTLCNETERSEDAQQQNNCTGQTVLRAICLGLICGIVLALVNSARPIGIIPIIAVFIWRFILRGRNRHKVMRRASMTYLLVLLLAYVFAGHVWDSYAARQLGQKPPSIPGYSIYVGFNPDTQGSYSDEDMELLQSRYFGEYDRNAEATQQSMLESAKSRIQETKSSIPSLMVHKLGTLLGHDEGGAFYSSESLSGRAYALWCISSNIWYYFVCILAVAGCLKLWKDKRSDSLWLVPLCLAGVILAQLLVEVAARYHYCLIPMLLLMAALSFPMKKPGSSAAR